MVSCTGQPASSGFPPGSAVLWMLTWLEVFFTSTTETVKLVSCSAAGVCAGGSLFVLKLGFQIQDFPYWSALVDIYILLQISGVISGFWLENEQTVWNGFKCMQSLLDYRMKCVTTVAHHWSSPNMSQSTVSKQSWSSCDASGVQHRSQSPLTLGREWYAPLCQV